MLLANFVDMWIEYHVIGLRPSTEESYRSIISIIKNKAGNISINELNALNTPLLWAEHIKKGQFRTAQLIYTVLKMSMNDAEKLGIITENPLKLTKKPKNVQKSIKFLDTFQAYSLIKRESRFQTAYALALLAGLRRGEIAALKWRNIQGSKIAVEASRARVGNESLEGPPKSVAGRRILPISSKLSLVLTSQNLKQRRYCLENGLSWSENCYVITEDGSAISDPRVLTQSLKRDLKRFNLPQVSFHSLRHSYATIAVEAGVEMRVLQSLLGHENIQTTAKFYAHVPESILINANNAISNLIT